MILCHHTHLHFFLSHFHSPLSRNLSTSTSTSSVQALDYSCNSTALLVKPLQAPTCLHMNSKIWKTLPGVHNCSTVEPPQNEPCSTPCHGHERQCFKSNTASPKSLVRKGRKNVKRSPRKCAPAAPAEGAPPIPSDALQLLAQEAFKVRCSHCV